MGKKKRKALSHDIRMKVLHEAGYRCAVPTCRTIITIDIHHIVYVSEEGSDSPDNLLALCPNCHGLHHMGKISTESIRAWKFLLLALNAAFDRRAVDLLAAMEKTGMALVSSGDALPDYAPLIVSGYADVQVICGGSVDSPIYGKMRVYLSAKGRAFLEAWKKGDQMSAIHLLP